MSRWLKRSQLEFTDSNGCILLRSDGAVAGHTTRIARQLSGILPLALVTGRWALREGLVVVMPQTYPTLGAALASRPRQDRPWSSTFLSEASTQSSLKEL